MKKASEYSKMCDADVCVGIRLRETGQVHILTADDSGFWAFLASQLVCHELRYPQKRLLILEVRLLPQANFCNCPRFG